LAEQNKAFLDFCDREGFEVAGTFADAVSSNGHAPGFRQLVAFLRERERGFVVVVIPSIQTLGHDLRDAAVRIFQLEGLGAQVTPMAGGKDAESALMAAWTNDGANGRLSDRVRAAMRRKAVKGEVLGRPPYGYKVGARRRLELVPEEAVVVRYIYRLYLRENMGIRLIARRLNEEGLRTRRGGNWSMVSIRDILRNRAYLGTYARFNVHVSGSHPSLVSPEDFHLVQDRLNARRTSYAPRQTSQFLLSGIAHCGYCGNKLIGVTRKQSWKRQSGETISNNYRYYQCESRTNQSVCGYHTRRAEALEEQIRDRLTELFADGGGFPQAGDVTAVLAEQRAEAERIRARLKSIDRRLEGYIDSASRGRITKERMHKLSVQAAAERLVMEDSLEAAERRLEEHINAADRKRTREGAIRRVLDGWEGTPFDELQAVLRDAVACITVSDDAVTVELRP
jgi:DNA invertase Pin-like site-specific DNA recombinase